MAARARGHLVLPVVQLGDLHHAPLARLDHELAEAVEPGVALVEVGVDLLHHLLEAVGAHDVAVAGHLRNRLARELPRIALDRRRVHLLREAGELVVGVVLVAVLDQQVARRSRECRRR